jgi:hypothetical protein
MASLQPSVGKETRWLECSKCLVFFFFKKKCSFKGLLDTISLESGEPFTARARALRCASKSLSGAL